MTKLCKDCKHYREGQKVRLGFTIGIENQCLALFSPVTGLPHVSNAEYMRAMPHAKCGPEAKLFKDKNEDKASVNADKSPIQHLLMPVKPTKKMLASAEKALIGMGWMTKDEKDAYLEGIYEALIEGWKE